MSAYNWVTCDGGGFLQLHYTKPHKHKYISKSWDNLRYSCKITPETCLKLIGFIPTFEDGAIKVE